MSTKEEQQFKPFLIGICGGSASGKTTAADFITRYLGQDNCLLFSLDNYFYGPNDEERKNIQNYNFDRPEALDLDLAYKHLLQLSKGETIEMPVYSFNVSRRMPYTQTISPKKVIIFEGIFALHEKRVRDIMNLKLFFDLDSDIRLMRRISRDISDRSRQIDTVLDRYLTFVKPAFDMYIKPTRKYADFVIPQGNFSSLPVQIISQHLNNAVLNIKIPENESNQKKNIKLTEEECKNATFFYDPQISILSVVKEKKDIIKFNKIIHYIISRKKASFYPIYNTALIEYLLETHKSKNKDGLLTYYLDESQLNDSNKIKEKINKDNKNCIITIFSPFLIQMKDKFKNDLISFINEFKEYKNVQFELMSVYLSYNTFKQLSEALLSVNAKVNFITVYCGEDLLKHTNILETGGFLGHNSVNLVYSFITRENLISEFHLNKVNY